jgi:uncharacterized protein
MQATIAELWIYPIKGCAGTRLDAVQALPTGLAHDRCMMVVDAGTGRFITQRSHAKMALIQPIIEAGTLHLRGLEQTPLSLPLQSGTMAKTVTVWGDTLSAVDMGDAAAAWFSQALGSGAHAVSLRLVRFDPLQHRAVKRYAQQGHLFADGYPYLVLSKASVHALNERLIAKGEQAVGVDRFRANIIIDAVDAHTEDYAASLHHSSGAALRLAAPCTRCQVPTIDQTTGISNPQHEPTMTLNAYRYDSALDGVTFGMNALINHGCELREGDCLSVTLSF